MEKVYYVSVDRYDYFAGGSKTETKRFSRIIDAYKFQRESAAHDYDYGDAWQWTKELRSRWDTTVVKTGKHVPKRKVKAKVTHVYTSEEIAEMFSPEEIDHLLNLTSEWGDVPFV